MKNTSIFIPLILIGCLAALIYLFFAALRAAEDNGGNNPDRITLNAEDYQDPADDPATLDPKASNDADTGNDTNFQDTYQEVAPDEEDDNDDTDTQVTPPSTPSGGTTGSETATAPVTTTTAAPPASSSSGRYLVIAGTFRQTSGANERVEALRVAGFPDARTERFNRGTFAVALAGQYDRYRSAKALADKIAEKGFEVRVMKKR